jgi:hypothetical protein
VGFLVEMNVAQTVGDLCQLLGIIGLHFAIHLVEAFTKTVSLACSKKLLQRLAVLIVVRVRLDAFLFALGEIIPEGMAGLSAENGDKATVGYDQRWRGLHIYTYRNLGTNLGYGNERYYFYSLVKGQEGLWPMTMGQKIRLALSYKSAVSTTDSNMLAIDSGGTCYKFSTDSSSESFSTVMWYGPIKLGRTGSEGMITEVAAVVAADSGDIRWGVYVADSAEEAFALDTTSPANFSTSWPQTNASFVGTQWTTTGKQYVQNPSVSGQSAFIKISSLNLISLDKLSVRIRETGLERVT